MKITSRPTARRAGKWPIALITADNVKYGPARPTHVFRRSSGSKQLCHEAVGQGHFKPLFHGFRGCAFALVEKTELFMAAHILIQLISAALVSYHVYKGFEQQTTDRNEYDVFLVAQCLCLSYHAQSHWVSMDQLVYRQNQSS